MFSLLENGFGKAPNVTGEISLSILKCLIENNPHKEKILKLHSLIKGAADYDEIKEKLPCVKPHGTFDGYCKASNFKSFSGYIFFDIDKGDIEEQKTLLLSKFANKIVMLGKSVGGKGIFFYLKVNPKILTVNNFLTVQNYIKDYYLKDFIIDNCAKGINRHQVIPYDSDLFFNDKAEEFDIDLKKVGNKSIGNKKDASHSINIKEGECSTMTCTQYVRFIDINELIPRINNQTFIDTGDYDALIEEHQHAKVHFRNKIIDGKKHSTFCSMVNALMFNNLDITLLEVQSYINYVNQRHTIGTPMKRKEMLRITALEYNRIKSTGEIFGTTKRGIALNRNLNTKQKISLRNKISGKLKKNKSFIKIKFAIDCLKNQNIEPKPQRVAKILKNQLKLRTIQEHFELVLNNDIEEITKIEINGYKINDKTTPKWLEYLRKYGKLAADMDDSELEESASHSININRRRCSTMTCAPSIPKESHNYQSSKLRTIANIRKRFTLSHPAEDSAEYSTSVIEREEMPANAFKTHFFDSLEYIPFSDVKSTISKEHQRALWNMVLEFFPSFEKWKQDMEYRNRTDWKSYDEEYDIALKELIEKQKNDRLNFFYNAEDPVPVELNMKYWRDMPEIDTQEKYQLWLDVYNEKKGAYHAFFATF